MPTLISDEDMRDIVVCGFESGSYGSLIIENHFGCLTPPKWAIDEDGKTWPRYSWMWSDGGTNVEDKYGDGESGVISRESLTAGLEVLREKYPHLLAQLVSGNYDVIAADALLQAAAFGDVIYG